MQKSLFRRFSKKMFIGANIVVGLLFLLGCYAYYFHPVKYWFLGLLNLGAFFLFLILLGFIGFWLLAKPRWTLLSLLFFVLAWQPLQHMLGFNFPKSFKIEKPANTIRVMSWNVEHFKILEHKTNPQLKLDMIALIKQNNPDVICMQEVVGSLKNENAINYLPAIMKEAGFSEQHFAFNTKLDFDGNHNFGILILSKLPIVKKEIVSNYPHDYNSIYQFTDLVNGADTFRVINLHLQSLKFSEQQVKQMENLDKDVNDNIKASKGIISKLKTGYLRRQKQSEKIAQTIANSPYPVVVSGDFNDLPNSYAYHNIGKNLKNAFAEKGFGLGRTYRNISPTLRIDNIFVSPTFSIEQYQKVDARLSDHYPLIVDLQLKK